MVRPPKPTNFAPYNKFATRLAGHQVAKKGELVWDGKTIKFPSRIELVRAAELILLARAGEITHLKFHPRYDHNVNGIKVWTYVADSTYRRKGEARVIVEDVKPLGAPIDQLSRGKLKLHDALFAKYMTLKIHNA
jgi:hypothetical protein